MTSLETVAEIVTRVEKKVDLVNGSVARVTDRVTDLERKELVYKTQIGMLKVMLATVSVPVLINVLNWLSDRFLPVA